MNQGECANCQISIMVCLVIGLIQLSLSKHVNDPIVNVIKWCQMSKCNCPIVIVCWKDLEGQGTKNAGRCYETFWICIWVYFTSY